MEERGVLGRCLGTDWRKSFVVGGRDLGQMVGHTQEGRRGNLPTEPWRGLIGCDVGETEGEYLLGDDDAAVERTPGILRM